jgi:hypothetical protein
LIADVSVLVAHKYQKSASSVLDVAVSMVAALPAELTATSFGVPLAQPDKNCGVRSS